MSDDNHLPCLLHNPAHLQQQGISQTQVSPTDQSIQGPFIHHHIKLLVLKISVGGIHHQPFHALVLSLHLLAHLVNDNWRDIDVGDVGVPLVIELLREVGVPAPDHQDGGVLFEGVEVLERVTELWILHVPVKGNVPLFVSLIPELG